MTEPDIRIASRAGDLSGAQEELLSELQSTWTGDNVVFKSIKGFLDYEIDRRPLTMMFTVGFFH